MELEKNGKQLFPLIKRGILTALISSWIGCFLFLIIDYLTGPFDGSFTSIQITGILFFFCLANLIMLFPVVITGSLLSILILIDIEKGNYSQKRSIVQGLLLGGGCGFAISIMIWVILCFLGHGCPLVPLFLSRTLGATFIAVIAGGVSGKIISDFVPMFS